MVGALLYFRVIKIIWTSKIKIEEKSFPDFPLVERGISDGRYEGTMQVP